MTTIEEAVQILDEIRTLGRRADHLLDELERQGHKPRVPLRPALSEREDDVLRGIADGLTNIGIAERLCLSPHTVKEHASALYRKLGVATRGHAIAEAARRGML